ncbi:MAG: CBS domain-containing protein [Chloroflexota bacterium]|nr:CBS domain-containing protein [Chloroflexota bacterium]
MDYLDELAEVRTDAQENLAAAGEHALKVLDRFLANLAHAIGMDDERASMGDSIRFLERGSGVAREIGVQAERFRDTRNALFHNPDIMLRPEAATRIIDGVEAIVRMAAEGIGDLARRRIVTANVNEPLADARDRMLAHRYDQLVVVDERGGVVDLLTERDIVVAESQGDIDDPAHETTVADAIASRGYLAVTVLPRTSSADEAVDALRDERIAAIVITEHGTLGQHAMGIITRGDVLKAR